MPDYCAYLLDKRGKIVRRKDLIASDAEAALAEARAVEQLRDQARQSRTEADEATSKVAAVMLREIARDYERQADEIELSERNPD